MGRFHSSNGWFVDTISGAWRINEIRSFYITTPWQGATPIEGEITLQFYQIIDPSAPREREKFCIHIYGLDDAEMGEAIAALTSTPATPEEVEQAVGWLREQGQE